MTEITPLLYVGNKDACDRWNGSVIHIWSDANVPGWTCRAWEGKRLDDERNCWLKYEDGSEIGSDDLSRCGEFAKAHHAAGHKILVHCAVGRTRSPTIALAALSAIAKRHPLDLLPSLMKPMWANGVDAQIFPAPLFSIVRHFERFPENRPQPCVARDIPEPTTGAVSAGASKGGG